MKTLVIGYGNSLRGDDGVGSWVAEQMAAQHWPEVRSLAIHQLTPELAADLAEVEIVYFVDAWISKDTQVQPRLQRLFPDSTGTTCDHSWNPGLLLALTKTLYDHEPIAYQWLIPVVQFEHGTSLSAIARDGADWVITSLNESFKPNSNDRIEITRVGTTPHQPHSIANRSPPERF
jgi:hydrogenase maturation protease